jgi:hypothetical protein
MSVVPMPSLVVPEMSLPTSSGEPLMSAAPIGGTGACPSPSPMSAPVLESPIASPAA